MSTTPTAEAPAPLPPKVEEPPPRKKEWAPRIWEGCELFGWLRLLCRNRFRVDLPYLYIAVIVTCVSTVHLLLKWVQQLIYGRRIARVEIKEPPIFIIGHWRTGTTLLHELMILDPRHGYPNTYQCTEPNHFLLTERLITKYLWFLMPSRRPMDNMAAGWDRPQEDEFALCMMGVPSPYLTIAFPRHGPACTEYFDLDGIAPRARDSWKRSFYKLMQRLTFKDPRRLVLKSPPHSCRIKHLLELFPDARFIHITRNPYVLFPSTMNLWKSLYEAHGLQRLELDWLEEYVLSTLPMLYDRLEEGRKLVPPGRFHQLRYEDLVKDPVGEMKKTYEAIGLDGFDGLVQPHVEAYWAQHAEYQTNRYKLSDEVKAKVKERWGRIIDLYGYQEPGR